MDLTMRKDELVLKFKKFRLDISPDVLNSFINNKDSLFVSKYLDLFVDASDKNGHYSDCIEEVIYFLKEFTQALNVRSKKRRRSMAKLLILEGDLQLVEHLIAKVK